MTLQRRGIILSLDGLGARALGPYGNAWYKTAHFNRLAGEGLLLEHCCATYPHDPSKWFQVFAKSGQPLELDLQLLTDDPIVLDMLKSAASRATFLQPRFAEHPAEDWIESELARFFSAATDELQELAPGQCLLLHSQALAHCWDAPIALRERLADEDDPAAALSTTPPALILPGKYDPDELFGWQQIYGAQIEVLDQCLGVLLDLIEEMPIADQPLLVVSGTRGFPLGEHRQVGFACESLFDETLHVPGFARWPGAEPGGFRALDLATPESLFYLAAAFILHSPNNAPSFLENPWPNKRQQIVRSESNHARSLRTHAWKYILPKSEAGGSAGKLFVKPDDRFDQNDVADRCPDIVSQFERLIEIDGDTSGKNELSAELAFGMN